MLSMFAFNFNLRRHNKVIGKEAATPTIEVDREGKVVETTVKTLFMRKSLKVRGRTFTPGAPRLVPAHEVLNYEGVSNFAFNLIVAPASRGAWRAGWRTPTWAPSRPAPPPPPWPPTPSPSGGCSSASSGGAACDRACSGGAAGVYVSRQYLGRHGPKFGLVVWTIRFVKHFYFFRY